MPAPKACRSTVRTALHSSYNSFSVAAAVLAPSLSSVSPTSYPADSSNHTMKLIGSNFQSGDTLTFAAPEGASIASNASKLTFNSSSELDYQFNDGSDAAPGTLASTIPTARLIRGIEPFTVAEAVLTPSISSVSPSSYPATAATRR